MSQDEPQPDSAEPALPSHLAAIVENSDDAIISKNIAGVIRTWNRGAEHIFGWRAEEIVGRSITAIIPPDRQQEEIDILARLRRGERIDHLETVRVAKTGQLLDVSVTISPVRDAAGRIVGASKIARDLTPQRKLERELARAKEQAEAAIRAKEELVRIFSRELRAPLAPALTEIGLLIEAGGLAESLRHRLELARRNLETEARRVDDLLDLAFLRHGKLELCLEAMDLHSAIRHVRASLQGQMDQKGIELTLSLGAAECRAWADPGRIQQILLNLLSNAIKFTPASGRIVLRSVNPVTGRVHIEISDSGPGIEPELLPQRAGGLAIARALAELHGGELRAANREDGRGARFTLELGTTGELPAASPPASAPARQELKVLLVEDHVDTADAMARLLRALGCQVEFAATAERGLALGQQGDFDLLISDLRLPDGSGLDIMRQLRGGRLRGVALSGCGQEEDVLASRAAGFDAHLTKPITLQALKQLIQSYPA